MRNANGNQLADQLRIGVRLRQAREARGMTINALAEETGLTKGFLSLVENDKANTSVANLVRICEALSVTVGSLFDAAETDFIASEDRPRINFGGEDLEEYLLTPRHETRLQMIESHIQPGGGSGPDDYSLRADAEVLHVISGELDLTIAGRTTHLKAGDSLTFRPSEPHRWQNPSSRRIAHVLWAVTPSPR